jgi:hypothetical protein
LVAVVQVLQMEVQQALILLMVEAVVALVDYFIALQHFYLLVF